jgi:hypothetical protein
MPYDPTEDRFWELEHRVTDLEDDVADLQDGPWLCDERTRPYNNRLSAERCCED